MKKRIIMKLAALFMTGILAVEAASAGIGDNNVYAAETDAVESESDGADSEFTGASGTGWVLDADGLLTISGEPKIIITLDEGYQPEWYRYSEKIKKVEVGAFKPNNTAWWFRDCNKIESISFADGFDTSNVTEMESMFRGCSGLTSLDVSGFNTSNVTDMGYMFSGCSSLASLDVSGFDISKVTDIYFGTYGMFDGTSLEYIKTPKLLEVEIYLPYEMYDKDGNAYTSFPCNLPESIILYKSRDYTPINDDVNYILPGNPVSSNGTVKWDCVWFGNYWQEDTNGDGVCISENITVHMEDDGTYRDQNGRIVGSKMQRDGAFFPADDMQPIKWRVLSIDSNGDALLLADKIIERHIYDQYLESSTWETCPLRSFLNSYSSSANHLGWDYSKAGLLSKAFTPEERLAISTTAVKNDDNPVYGTSGGNDTQDKLFCLSISEAMSADFGFVENNEFVTMDTAVYDPSRIAIITAFVDFKSTYQHGKGPNSWWLRSPGSALHYASYVSEGGGVSAGQFEHKNSDNKYVRPALYMNLSSHPTLWSPAGTVCSDGTEDEIAPFSGGTSNPTSNPNSDSYDPEKAKYTGVCGDSLTWYFYAEDQTLVVSGNGAMTDHPWTGQDYAKDIKKIILPDGMTEICAGAFNDLTGGNITIPKSVTVIAEGSLGHIGMVYGYKGSAAQKYAYANNMLFMDLDDPIDLNSVIYASANPTKNVKKNKKYVADAKAGLIDSSKVDTSYGVDNSPETLKGIVRQRASRFVLCADRYYSNLGKSLVSKNKQKYDKVAIEAGAKGFICFDDNSCPDDYKQAVYLAVGELFNEGFMEYENGSIKKIDTDSWYSGSKFVNSVSEMVRSLSLSGEIKKVRVKSCNYTVRFGGMGVYDFTIVKEGKTFSKKTGHLVIKNDTVQPFLNAYMENLAELQKEQNMEVIKAVGKDIKRISGVSKLTDSYIDESVEANATVLKACGYGSLGTVLKDLKVVYGLTNEVDRCGGSDSSIGNCKDHIEMLKKITFSDPDLSNNELSKATSTLKSAYDDFLYALICYQMGVNPESYKTSWFTWGDNNKKWLYDHRIHCPVDIEVLDKESGERLGSIEDGVPQFDKNRLYMEVNGDHKSVYTVDGTEIVIKLIGKDDAFMDYSVEQISLTEGIVGRINYYDLPLTDGGTYTLDFPGDTVFSNDYIPDLKNPNGQAVKPSEYIDADRDDGYATISVTDCKYGEILGEGCYPRGDTVELSVQPTDDDYIFKGWFIDGEAVETDYTYQFTSKEDLNVEAVFAPAVNPYAYSYSTSLKLDKKKITGTSGEAVKLNAKVKKKGIYDVSINWISSNPAVASVFALPENAAEVRLLSPGTAYVTAVCGSKAKSVKVTVLQPSDKIEASINMISLSVKEKYRIPIVSSVPTTDKILFKSTAPKVCTVDEKGIVTAKAAGSAEIKIITYDNKKASAVEKDSINVVVTNDMISETDVKDVSVNYVGNKDMYVGEKAFISLMIEGTHNGGGSLKYEYDHKIISIDKFGHVSAKKPGETSIVAVYDGIRSNELRITVKQPLKLYKVNKSYVKVAAPKAGKSSKKVTFTVKTNPTAKKFTDGGGKVIWTVTSKDTGISLKSDDGKGKAVFEVTSGASDTIVTATISDPVTGKTYSTDCMIDVK